MSHEIEISQTGTAAFVDNRDDAWHRLNNLPAELVGQKLTAEEVLLHASLANWDVRKIKLYAQANGTKVQIDDKFANVRTNPFTGEPEYLGVVGRQYTAVQNEAHCQFLNTLVDESGALFETAGSLRNGRNVFVTMKLPTTMRVGGQDEIDVYVAGLNSHDGTSAFTTIVSPVRVVCKNTQDFAISKALQRFAIRHTRNATSQVEAARQGLQLTFKYLDEFQAEADRMISETLAADEFRAIVRDLWPTADESDSKRGATIATERENRLMWLFNEAPTQENIRGTKWAGFQSVSEYLDHYVGARAGADANGDDVNRARSERVLVSSQLRGDATRQATLTALAALS